MLITLLEAASLPCCLYLGLSRNYFGHSASASGACQKVLRQCRWSILESNCATEASPPHHDDPGMAPLLHASGYSHCMTQMSSHYLQAAEGAPVRCLMASHATQYSGAICAYWASAFQPSEPDTASAAFDTTPMNSRMSSHALPDWKVGMGGEHETEYQFIFNCDAYCHIRRSPKFRPLLADLEATLHAFYHKFDYFLIAKFLLQCRGERIKVIRYHDLDIRT